MSTSDHASTSSCFPDRLFEYQLSGRDGELHLLEAALPNIRRSLEEFLGSHPDYGSEMSRLHLPVAEHLRRCIDLDDWVGGVAMAFLEAGRSAAPLASEVRGRRGDEVHALWTAGDVPLTNHLFADSPAAEVERQRARAVADSLVHSSGDLEATRRSMKELSDHADDIVFIAAFLNRLGPGGTLTLERELVEMTRYSRYSGAESPDAFTELLGPLNSALATATSVHGSRHEDNLADGFVVQLCNERTLSPADLSNLIQGAHYSTDFLVTVGRRLTSFSTLDLGLARYPALLSERWPEVLQSGFDPLAAPLEAIQSDPDACLRLLTESATAVKLLRIGGAGEDGRMAGIVHAALTAGDRDQAAQARATLTVLQQFVNAGQAGPEMSHTLAGIVCQRVAEFAVDADLPVAVSMVNADGTLSLNLPDLDGLLRLAVSDRADLARVVAAVTAWAARTLSSGPPQAAAAMIGRTFGMLVRASDQQVVSAVAADERRRALLDGIAKVIGLVPVAGGPLVAVGAEGGKILVSGVLQGALQTEGAGAAVVTANTFNDAMILQLDYLVGAAAFAKDPTFFSSRVPAPVVASGGRLRLARPDEAPREYQVWYRAYEAELTDARTQMDAGFELRKAEFRGR